jgi:hypothetical protein
VLIEIRLLQDSYVSRPESTSSLRIIQFLLIFPEVDKNALIAFWIEFFGVVDLGVGCGSSCSDMR